MVEYRSSIGAFKDFLESTVWMDMKAELENALQMTRDGLESAETWDASLRLQSAADTLRRVMEMPMVILEDLEVPVEKESSQKIDLEEE